MFKSNGKTLTSFEAVNKILAARHYQNLAINSEGDHVVAWGDGFTSYFPITQKTLSVQLSHFGSLVDQKILKVRVANEVAD
jgi:hypothetical protein